MVGGHTGIGLTWDTRVLGVRGSCDADVPPDGGGLWIPEGFGDPVMPTGAPRPGVLGGLGVLGIPRY